MVSNPLGNRIESLDVFRGITIFGMILVNNPGSWEFIYAPLRHAEWHGITPTDLVFPFFLFIVGTAIPFALSKYREGEDLNRAVFLKIFRRALMIFLLGILLSATPAFDLENLRIPGVLQRIAICYLICSLLFLRFDWKALLGISVGILLFYYAVMRFVSVPGCEVTSIADKACNLSAYIDRLVLGTNHIWSLSKVYDPEGILSTLPAIVSTLCGVFTGLWFRAKRGRFETVSGLLFFGVSLSIAGWFLSLFYPLNKALWTGSYVIITTGAALSILGCCYWLIDINGMKRWSFPFHVFGVNALALYVGAEMFAKLIDSVGRYTESGELVSLKTMVFESYRGFFSTPELASLMFALSIVTFWFVIMWILYKNEIYIKV